MYALVTGASSGIGKEIAKTLAKKGYDLIITARREERLKQLKEEIEKETKSKVVTKVCDLTNAENINNLHKECSEYDVNVVVNNAGFGVIGFFNETDIEKEIKMIDTNITALYILTKLFTKSMKKGHILNVSSLAAFLPDPKMAVYGASKSFVLNFSKAVNYELKRQNKDITITTLCPGPVYSEFNDVAGGSFNFKAITAKKCADIAIKGMFKKKSVIIPGLKMKLTRFFSKITPSKLVLKISYNIQNNKTTKYK